MIKVSNVNTAGTAIQAAKEPASVAQDSAFYLLFPLQSFLRRKKPPAAFSGLL